MALRQEVFSIVSLAALIQAFNYDS
jgi:hypothetical protein